MSIGAVIQQSYLNITYPGRVVVIYTSYESLQFALEKIWEVGSLFCSLNSKKSP